MVCREDAAINVNLIISHDCITSEPSIIQISLSSTPHMAPTPAYILLQQAYQQQNQPPSLATNLHKMPLSLFNFLLLVWMHQAVPYRLLSQYLHQQHTNMCVEISNNSFFCLTRTPPGRHSMRPELHNVLGIEERLVSASRSSHHLGFIADRRNDYHFGENITVQLYFS